VCENHRDNDVLREGRGGGRIRRERGKLWESNLFRRIAQGQKNLGKGEGKEFLGENLREWETHSL